MRVLVLTEDSYYEISNFHHSEQEVRRIARFLICHCYIDQLGSYVRLQFND